MKKTFKILLVIISLLSYSCIFDGGLINNSDEDSDIVDSNAEIPTITTLSGYTTFCSKPTLSWTAIDDASGYKLKLSTSSTSHLQQ